MKYLPVVAMIACAVFAIVIGVIMKKARGEHINRPPAYEREWNG